MPHHNIHLRIVCGETTCAVTADVRCEFLEGYDRRPGGHCQLFGRLHDGPGGWIARHPACIAASTPAEKPKGSA